MKDYELLRSKFAQPLLSRFCIFCAYARPRYQVNVYRTIGSLVFIFFQLFVAILYLLHDVDAIRGPFGKFVAWHHNSTVRK